MVDRFGDMAPGLILRKRKAIVRELREKPRSRTVRLAVLGSSTTQEFVDFLEVLLLAEGLEPTFHQGGYNRYFEETVLASSELESFEPEVVILFTGSAAIRSFPPLAATEDAFQACLEGEFQRFRQIWDALEQRTSATILQTTFEPPSTQVLGSLEGVSPGGRLRFCRSLNDRFCREAQVRRRLMMLDQASVFEHLGQDRILDPRRWFSAKLLTTPEGSLDLARAAAGSIRALFGRSRKGLVLDLDNTLWGGVLGDDGLDGIQLGRETPKAEAYTAFQEYCKRLKERGILLAVCSKNELATAKLGFNHPDAILKEDDFAAFKANWEPKPVNLKAIAQDLNLGLDSLVFIDDNPAERHLVASQLPMVAVPDVGSDVEHFIRIIEAQRYFETTALLEDDLLKSRQYLENRKRQEGATTFQDYDAYLRSLDMRAEIGPWQELYLDRITQLCNKTNQYNLMTQRYTLGEIQAIHRDPSCLTLYGKLSDAFGDNGLVSVVFGRCEDGVCTLETWLMSCRVLKRDMEMAMLDALVVAARARGLKQLLGCHKPTEKNGLVTDHYERLGFQLVQREDSGLALWSLGLEGPFTPRNRFIREVANV